MPVQRIMGLETEYGILDTEHGLADLHESSAQAVEAYRAFAPYSGPRWDYSGESPLHDARGFQVAREYADPSMLTDDPLLPATSAEDHNSGQVSENRQTGQSRVESSSEQRGNKIPVDENLAARQIIQRAVTPTEVVRLTPWEERFQKGHNLALANGGRLYVDHSHPEYSTPEVTNPTDALIWDWAGAEMLAQAVNNLAPQLRLFKNNTDGKAVSYGCHENYLVARTVPFETWQEILIPFLVTRPLIVGAGRLGRGIEQTTAQFQISQRADFIDREVGLHTTVNRPIINTRDEPHADPDRWRRLHVIIGDANRSPASTWLKLAATSLVLNVVESRPDLLTEMAKLKLADPVAAVTEVSYDLLGKKKLLLADGRRLSAAQIQRRYWQLCQAAETPVQNSPVAPQPDSQTARALKLWDELLTVFELPAQTEAERLAQLAPISPRVEWVARWQLLTALQQRRQLPWNSPVLQAADLQWSEITGKGGLAGALFAAGQLEGIEHWADRKLLTQAQTQPPTDTRAWLRGTLIRWFPQAVTAASWHSIVLDDQETYLKRLPLTEITEWTQSACEKVVQSAIKELSFAKGNTENKWGAREENKEPNDLAQQTRAMRQITSAFTKDARPHPGETYGNLWY